MATVPDFTKLELDTIRTLTEQRYQEPVEIYLADADLRLNADSDELTKCPTVFWQARDCSFVAFKTDASEYRCQFFYDPSDQFGTGHDSYREIGECVAALFSPITNERNKVRFLARLV